MQCDFIHYEFLFADSFVPHRLEQRHRVNRDTVQKQAWLLFWTPPQAAWHILSANCDSKQNPSSDIVHDVIKCLTVSFDLGIGGFNQGYPTLCGQRITAGVSLIEHLDIWFKFIGL